MTTTIDTTRALQRQTMTGGSSTVAARANPGTAGGAGGVTNASIATGFDRSPAASQAALDAQNQLSKFLLGNVEADDRRMREATRDDAGSAGIVIDPRRTQNMTQLAQRAVMTADIKESAVNVRLAAGESFGTGGIVGRTDAEVDAMSTDTFINALNDSLVSGIRGIASSGLDAGSGTFTEAAFSMLNGIQDTQHAPGTPGYRKGALDRINDRMVSTMGKMRSVADEAMQTHDPAKLASLAREMAQLVEDFHRLLKEKEKHELLQRLLLQLMSGVLSPDLVNKLRDMGLGSLVDEVVRGYVRSMRRAGNITPQVVAMLENAGYGSLVAPEADAFTAEAGKRARERATPPKPTIDPEQPAKPASASQPAAESTANRRAAARFTIPV